MSCSYNHFQFLFIYCLSYDLMGVSGFGMVGGRGRRFGRWEELCEERRLREEGVEEGEEGTAAMWVTGWTHDVV